MTKKIGLLFGSFNPIHQGHIKLAQQVLNNSSLNIVEFILTPQNPFKYNQDLAPEKLRLKWIKKALEGLENLFVNSIELKMPRPSYTVDTLKRLKKERINDEFQIILGEDNWLIFHQWKGYQWIIEHFNIHIYHRKNCSSTFSKKNLSKNFNFYQLESYEISSNQIRKKFKKKSEREEESIKNWLSESIYEDVKKYYSSSAHSTA